METSILVDFKEFQGNDFKECQRECFQDVSVSLGKRLTLPCFFLQIYKSSAPATVSKRLCHTAECLRAAGILAN